MTDLLDSSALRVAAYVVVGGLALLTGLLERRIADRRAPGIWPTFWFLGAALLSVMAIARSSGFVDLVAEAGRDRARQGGWYDTRRHLQVVVVVAMWVTWFVTVVVSIWRVPPRRRRYLPAAITLATIVAFAAVRAVSLHQVDTVLYRRDVAGVRIVAVAELSLLAVAFVVIVRSWRSAKRTPRGGMSTPAPSNGRITTGGAA